MNLMDKHAVHPNLMNGAAQQEQAEAGHVPFMDAPHCGRGRGRAAVMMPADRRLVLSPLHPPSTVHSPSATAVIVQNPLNDSI